jgi:hypothetical protein
MGAEQSHDSEPHPSWASRPAPRAASMPGPSYRGTADHPADQPHGAAQHVVEVHRRVHIGTLHGAWMWEALKERKITHVLNMQDYSLCPQAFAPELFTYLVANAGAEDAGPSGDEVTSQLACPRGHALNLLAAIPLWQCSHCGQRSGENPRARCAACSYDLCRGCVAMRRQPRNCATAAVEGVAGEDGGDMVVVLSDAVSPHCTELHAREMKNKHIRPSGWWADARGPLTTSQLSARAEGSTAFAYDVSRGRTRIQETNAFIRQGVQDGGVFVHCCSNALSTAAVAAYLMQSEDIPLDYALDLLESKRPFGYLGGGLLSLLRQYELSLRSGNPAHATGFFSWNAPAAATFSTADGTDGLGQPASCNRHEVAHGKDQEMTRAGDSFTGSSPLLALSGQRRRSLRAYLSRPESCNSDVRGYLVAEDMEREGSARSERERATREWPTSPQPSVRGSDGSCGASSARPAGLLAGNSAKRDHLPTALAHAPVTWSYCRTLSQPPPSQGSMSGAQPADKEGVLPQGALAPRVLFC